MSDHEHTQTAYLSIVTPDTIGCANTDVLCEAREALKLSQWILEHTTSCWPVKHRKAFEAGNAALARIDAALKGETK